VKKIGGRKMQEIAETTHEDVARLKKRVQHLEEEVAKIKMKMGGKKWL
jgi:polyhydroxyalkanoate synthesis regulator phasin